MSLQVIHSVSVSRFLVLFGVLGLIASNVLLFRLPSCYLRVPESECCDLCSNNFTIKGEAILSEGCSRKGLTLHL